MNWKTDFFPEGEQPLDRFPTGISNTAIFRTVAIIGDSLSSGEFESRDAEGNPDWHDYFEHSWGQYMARKNGQVVYNFSRGGMSALEYVKGFADQQRFWRPELAAQAYIIALGVNDVINGGMEIGSAKDDVDPADRRNNARNFMGYYAEIIQRYKELQPRARFFLVTLPRHGDAKDALREELANALIELAEVFEDVYVIDLFKHAPVYDEEFREKFFMYNHMNASGYILTANMIDAYIDFIIRRNLKDFEDVPFTGTCYK